MRVANQSRDVGVCESGCGRVSNCLACERSRGLGLFLISVVVITTRRVKEPPRNMPGWDVRIRYRQVGRCLRCVRSYRHTITLEFQLSKSALRINWAVCHREKKTSGKPTNDRGSAVCQHEVGPKPASGTYAAAGSPDYCDGLD